MKQILFLFFLLTVLNTVASQNYVTAGDTNNGYIIPYSFKFSSDGGVTFIPTKTSIFSNRVIGVEVDSVPMKTEIYGIALNPVYPVEKGTVLTCYLVKVIDDSTFVYIDSSVHDFSSPPSKQLKVDWFPNPSPEDQANMGNGWEYTYIDTCQNVGEAFFPMIDCFFKHPHPLYDGRYILALRSNKGHSIYGTGNPPYIEVFQSKKSKAYIFIDNRNGSTPTFSLSINLYNGRSFPIISREMWLENICDLYNTPEPPLVFVDDTACITVHWSNQEEFCFHELAYGPADSLPDSYISITLSDSSFLMYGLELETEYAVRIRGGVCYSDSIICWSNWSDTVHFTTPHSTVAVPSVVDSHTFLFPNPASDQVQVASSFRISTVEVYSLSGQLVSRVKADGISATLDTRSLPSATYLVRIATNHGTAVKKLVIE